MVLFIVQFLLEHMIGTHSKQCVCSISDRMLCLFFSLSLYAVIVGTVLLFSVLFIV